MIELHRQDVVGKRVRHVLQSEWDTSDDDISTCAVYVLLEDGTLFELGFSDEGLNAGRVYASSVPVESLRPAELLGAVMHCQGDTVLEVVASEYWLTFGLLLSNNCFLHVDSPGPGKVGACLSPVGGRHTMEDVVPLWSLRATNRGPWERFDA